MKNILITGANGLIGKSLLPLLAEENNLFAITSQKNIQNTKNVTFIPIDLSKEWNTSILPNNIDLIIHLAQSAHFRDFPEKSQEVFAVNTDSTLKLLHYAQQIGVKKFIYASSGGVYGNGEQHFAEDSPLAPSGDLGFYLSTKLCSEILLESFIKFFDIITLRLFFVYGKNQKKSMLIPRLVDNVKESKTIILQGENGIKINPIHVDDAVIAIQNSLSLLGSHKINIAGNEVLSLKQIVEIIETHVGKKAVFKIQNQEIKNLVADTEKMERLLHIPSINLKMGLSSIV